MKMAKKNTFFSKLIIRPRSYQGWVYKGSKKSSRAEHWGSGSKKRASKFYPEPSGSPNASSYEHPSAKISLHEDKDVPQKKEWKSKVETIYVTIKLGMNIRTRIKQSSYK